MTFAMSATAGRLKAIALASAVGVSAGLITLTVAVMISKNMHRVDTESVDDVNKHPAATSDTVCCESAEQTLPVRKGKISDIPEESEDLSDTSHPSIIPLMDAPPIKEVSGRSSASNFITVHYSRMSSPDQVQVHNMRGERKPRDSSKVVYTLLPQPGH